MSEVRDLIDQAQQQAEHNLAAQLANAAKPVPRLMRTGACHTCDNDVGEKRLFCDAKCAGLYRE